MNAEEGTSEELFVEVMSEIGSDEENPGTNPAPPVYAKAGGQNVENITNPGKFAKVMQSKRQEKEKQIAQDENKAELDKFHVLQANLPEKLWHIFKLQLAEWTTTRPPWKAYEAAVW
uniref:Uncharacterized protein n=1 Tax=Romanomermis culicivorax TaxID=13658 RepID=A0A915KYV7_ROMCU